MKPLFCTYDWFSVSENQIQKLRESVSQYDANKLLNTSTEDLCDYFFQKYSINVPKLLLEEIIADEKETEIDVSQDRRRAIYDRSRPVYIQGTRIEIIVPFHGEAILFDVRPTTHTLSPPRATVQGNKLIFGFTDETLDANAVRSGFDKIVAEIERHLSTLRNDADKLNDKIKYIANESIEVRKSKLLKNQNTVAALGFPLRQRKDAVETYVAPQVRRNIQPQPPAASTSPYVPEPVLSSEDYEHILSIIKNMALVMERSPSAFASLDEEALRTHFLVQLNGHFEGAATGETFNYSGKTDILIRIEDKNIFIGECKFWSGPKKMTEAIDQILNYSSWRDTKTAIIVFNKNKDFSTVLKSINSTTESHKNYKKTLSKTNETIFKYIFSHKADKNRELILTVLAFDVPSI